MVFKLAWARNGTPDTLSGTSDTITISDQTSTKFNQYMCHMLGSGNIDSRLRLGNTSVDTGSNYADRVNNNGSSDTTQTSQDDIHVLNGAASGADQFLVGYLINISAEEKLHIGFAIGRNTAGAGTAPQRMEITSKWVNTSNQFDNIQALNTDTGDFATSSNLSALGTN